MAPVVSVLTAVHDPERSHLEACLASVRAQTLSDWQHVIVDDGSTAPHVAELLDLAAADPRVVVVRRPSAGGIVAASRDALERATGTFVALLDHDDLLEPHALAAMVGALGDDGDLAYSDHDVIGADGSPGRSCLKPDFSPEHLRNQNYVLHLVVARRALVVDVGGFREGFDGAQDHDLLLRLVERTDRVRHVPEVLYHWRRAAASVAADPSAKPWAYAAGERAVREHCERIGLDADVVPGPISGTYRVRRRVADPPRVSVVIPTRGTSRRVWGVTRCFVVEAVRSLVERSTYPDLEFVVVHDSVTPQPVLDLLRLIAGERLRLVEFTEPFNFSTKINVGVAASSGELVLILNDDTELIAPDSIEAMVAHLADPTVGMVGAKLLFADGTIQDAGHVYHGSVLPGLAGWSGNGVGPGQLRPLAVEREVSGVTAAAAMVRRSVHDEVGGLDPVLWMNFNDVDYCLKVRRTGRRIVWSPYASWYHFESQTRPPSAEPEEFDELDRRWHHEINHDPYYNPNFVERRADWLERPWRSGTEAVYGDGPERSTIGWLLSVLRRDVSARRPLSIVDKFAPLLLAVCLVVCSRISTDWVDVPPPRRFAAGIVPAAVWWALVQFSVYRERWPMVAGLAVLASPFVMGALGGATGTALVWSAVLLAGVGLRLLFRRSRLVGGAALGGLVALAVSSWWGHGAPRFASGDFVAADELAGVAQVAAIVVWSLSVVLVLAWTWSTGRRGAVAGVIAVVAAVTAVGAAVGQLDAVAVMSLLPSLAVAVLASSTDPEAGGARRTATWSMAAVAASWTLATLAAVPGRSASSVVVGVVGALAVLAGSRLRSLSRA
jgi:GT2 family glycosyltransferase